MFGYLGGSRIRKAITNGKRVKGLKSMKGGKSVKGKLPGGWLWRKREGSFFLAPNVLVRDFVWPTKMLRYLEGKSF